MKRYMFSYALALGIAALFMATPASAQAPLWLGDWYPAFELQFTADDNVNRSLDGDGEKNDVIFEPALRVERQFLLADQTFSYVAGELAGAIHGRFHRLNHVAPGVDVGIRQQLGDQPDAPALQAGVRLKYEFHEQDPRFGAEINPRLAALVNAGDVARGELYYEYDNRFASENSVYDRDGHTIGLEGELAVNEQLSLTLEYSYRRGDVLVHQPRDDLGVQIKGRRFPVNTFSDRYDAVKIRDGDTHTLGIGVRYAVTLYTSLTAGLAYEEIRADGDKYPSNQLLLGVQHLL